MPVPLPPSPISRQYARSAMFAATRESIRSVSGVLAVMFTILALAHVWFGIGSTMAGALAMEVFSAIFMLALRIAVGRWRIPDRWIYPTLVLSGSVALLNTDVQLYLSGLPQDSTNFAVMLVGVGLVSLSITWSAVFMTLTWITWLYLMIVVHPGGDIVHYGFMLSWATAMSIVAQTVRKRLLYRVLEAEARHQILVEHLPLISYVKVATPTGGPIYISPQVEQLLGYSQEEWLSRPDFWQDCLYPPDKERTLAAIRDHVQAQTSWELEYRMLTRDGLVRWFQNRSTRFVDTPGQPPLAYGFVLDITERKRAEALRTGAIGVFERLASGAPIQEVLSVLLRASEDIHTGIIGSIYQLDDDGRLRYLAAPSLPDIYRQCTDGVAIGPDAASCGAAAFLGKRVVVEDIAADPNWTEQREVALRAGLRSCWSEPILASSGRVIGTLAIYSRQQGAPPPVDQQLMQTAARLAGMVMQRVRNEADLASYREHLEELVAERTRELELSLDRLRHSERLAAVGTLAAGIAHEINNPVGLILLSAERLLQTTAKPEEADNVHSYLQDIVANAKRCGKIVKSVLHFAQRNDLAERRADDVNVVVRAAVELTRSHAANRGGAIELELQDSLPPVLLNRLEMEQVVINLIRNGIESSIDAPRIVIGTEFSGSVVRIKVRDHGPGVSDENRRRVFDPFFTTRQTEGGTGLGLSLAYGIVSGHGGSIDVKNAPGGGAVAIVELPVVTGGRSPPPASVQRTATVSPASGSS
jgi:PAS domain S-box-containing protein